jgi:predicted amino acid-binding ACT domain protein
MLMRRLRGFRLSASTRSARAKIQKQLARMGGGDVKELRESLQIEALTLAGALIPDKLGPGPRTIVYCECMFELIAADRTGLLATVSAAITKAGANIDSYTGVKIAENCFKMNFALHFDDNELRNGASLKGLDENLSRLFTEVTEFKGVSSGALYCDVDAARDANNGL